MVFQGMDMTNIQNSFIYDILKLHESEYKHYNSQKYIGSVNSSSRIHL